MNGLLPPVESLAEQRPFETLADWQDWVAQDWVHPIGTEEAQHHTRAKLEDEVSELHHALVTGSDEEIKDELGDVLWTATGTAFNTGIQLKECLFYDDGDEELSVSLTDLERHITTIDRSPFEYTSPEAKQLRYNEPDFSEPIEQIEASAHHLGKGAKQYFVWDTKDKLGADAWSLVKRGRAVKGLKEIFFACGVIAQDRLGITLSEVMEHNREKLTGRIERGEPVTKLPDQ